MTNSFYYYAQGNKYGPYDIEQIRMLVQKGVIAPTTGLEDSIGRRGLAKQIPGLFSNSSPHDIYQIKKNTGQYQERTAPKNDWQGNTDPNGSNANSFGKSNSAWCTNCGASVMPDAVACMSCGAAPVGHRKFCHSCGTSLKPEQITCTKCGSEINPPQNMAPNGYNNAGNYGQAGYQNQPGMNPGQNEYNYAGSFGISAAVSLISAIIAIFGINGIQKAMFWAQNSHRDSSVLNVAWRYHSYFNGWAVIGSIIAALVAFGVTWLITWQIAKNKS